MLRRAELTFAALLLPACALAQATKNYAAPQYHLPGSDYSGEAPSVNQMFQNVYVETQYLQKQIPGPSAVAATVASTTLCDRGGVLVASGTMNQVFTTTINAVGLLESSRTYHLDLVVLATAAVNYGLRLNTDIRQSWDLEERCGTALIREPLNFSYDLPMAMDGTGNIDTAYVQAATWVQGSYNIVGISSTTFRVIGFATEESNFTGGGAGMCVFQVAGTYQGSSTLSSISFGTNSKASNTQPFDSLTPMNGHWHLCAEGWQDSQ